MSRGAFALPRRGRARAGAVTAVVAAVVAVGAIQVWPAGASGSPSRPVDRDANDYVLLAQHSIHLKSSDSATPVEMGGDIGVNLAGGQINVCGGGGSHPLHMADGTQIVADNVNGDSDCSLWDLYTNNLTGGSSPVVRNSGPTTFTTPIIATMPTFPSFTCGANDVKITTPTTLAPGVYGNLSIQAHLTLQSGTYTFCKITSDSGQTLTTASGTIVQVQGAVALNGDHVGDACDAWFYIANALGDSSSSFGKEGSVTGHVYAIGDIALGHGETLTGAFWGDHLDSDFNTSVLPCTPQTTTTTSTSTSSSTSTSTSTTVPVTSTTIANESSTTSTSTTTVPQSTTTITEAGSTTTTVPQTSTIPQSTTTITESGSTVPGQTTTTFVHTLPFTGSSSTPPLFGLVSLLGGAVMLLITRRRQLRRS